MTRTATWIVTVIALVVGLAAPARFAAAGDGTADAPLPLHVAVERGLVDVEVVGRGASTGDSVEVRVKRRNNAKLNLSVEPGTVIQPTGANVQTMALAGVKYKQSRRGYEAAERIELNDNTQQTYILEGYCRDFEKPTPTSRNAFAVQGPDQDNAKILVQAKKLGATVKITQSAIWIQRSGLSDEQLQKRFEVSSDELKAARGLLVSVQTSDEKVDVDLSKVLADLRQLPAKIRGTTVKRGDIVEVVTADATFVPRTPTQTVSTLDKGQQLFVVAAWKDEAIVRRDVDGQTTRGTVKLSDVTVVKPAVYPVARAIREVVDAVNLEVFDKVDVEVQTNR